jgi:acetolactate synthase-1/2/3 large subunit
VLSPQAAEILRDRQHQRELLDRRGAQLNQFALHPLRIVRAMQDIVNSDVTLTVDMGSFHIWIARYLYSFRARQVMISNGQQTMGVALPWAIGAWLVNPERKVVSVSGDGGFLQSSMELETAVRLKANVLHLIWVDNGYNMVAIQEEKNISACPASSSGRWILKPMPNPSAPKGLPWKAPRRWSRPCARRWTSTARRWWPSRWIIAITRC